MREWLSDAAYIGRRAHGPMLKIILAIGGIQVAAILISIVRSKVVAVLLGPAGVGVVSVIDQVVQLITYLSAFSLPMAAVRFLSRAHSEGEEPFRRTYAAFLQAIVGLSTTGVLIALAIIAIRPQWLGAEIGDLKGVLRIAVLAVPAMILSGFLPNVFAAAQKVRSSAAVSVVTNAALAAAAVVGILAGGVAGMYVATVSVLTATVIAGLLYLRGRLHLPLFAGGGHVVRELKANREVVWFSAMFSLAAVASSAALLMMRHAVLSSGGQVAAGLLQSAYALGLAINMVLNPTNGLYLTPIMNRNIPEAEKLQTALSYQSRLAVILVLVCAPLVLLPKTALFVLFSGRFVEVGQWVFLFVLAQLVLQFAGVYQAVLIGVNSLKTFALVTAGGHAVTGAAALILASRWGVPGAGAALLLGAVVAWIAGLAALQRRSPEAFDWKPFLLPLYAIAACAVAAAVGRGLPEWSLGGLAIRVLVGVASVAGAVALLPPDGRHELLQLAGGVGRLGRRAPARAAPDNRP
jgi:O-antigen/teichoic acid export membrane protein